MFTLVIILGYTRYPTVCLHIPTVISCLSRDYFLAPLNPLTLSKVAGGKSFEPLHKICILGKEANGRSQEPINESFIGIKQNKTNSKNLCFLIFQTTKELKRQIRKTVNVKQQKELMGWQQQRQKHPKLQYIQPSAFADWSVMVLTSLKWPQRSTTWSNLQFRWGITINLAQWLMCEYVVSVSKHLCCLLLFLVIQVKRAKKVTVPSQKIQTLDKLKHKSVCMSVIFFPLRMS